MTKRGEKMKKFKEQFPDHSSFENDSFIMNEIPDRLLSSLSSIYIKGARQKISNYNGFGRLNHDSVIKTIVNKVAEYAVIESTKNWGGEYLIQDLEWNISALDQVPF